MLRCGNQRFYRVFDNPSAVQDDITQPGPGNFAEKNLYIHRK